MESREQIDESFMRRALELARATVGLASPNPQVGCVIVSDGEIVGEGAHIYDERDHAEIVALRQAGERGADLSERPRMSRWSRAAITAHRAMRRRADCSRSRSRGGCDGRSQSTGERARNRASVCRWDRRDGRSLAAGGARHQRRLRAIHPDGPSAGDAEGRALRGWNACAACLRANRKAAALAHRPAVARRGATHAPRRGCSIDRHRHCPCRRSAAHRPQRFAPATSSAARGSGLAPAHAARFAACALCARRPADLLRRER